MTFQFSIEGNCSETRARAGTLQLPHGTVHTPVFMPVGTLGTVKSLTPEDLLSCGAQILLGNTYHLYLRPGCDVIRLFSGLHRFMNWHRPILTDSGGFQVFSLARLSTISDEGYAFQSHIDGSRHLLTPEKAVEIQCCLDSDILMCLDQCIPYPAGRELAESAAERTSRWAWRCRSAMGENRKNTLFGIVQGGMYADIRRRSAEQLIELDFPGYAVGGLSVGEPKSLMMEMADATLPLLPKGRPRYIMGVGTPEDLVELVALGADMFDCVMPTRNARNGQLFTASGNLNIANARHTHSDVPIQENCTCYTCRHFSRAYLRHLYMNRELLGYRLHTLHNLHYYIQLMTDVREAVLQGRFPSFRREFHARRSSG